jgi:hypothetical protein
VLEVLLVFGGFVLGALVARWWAVLAAAAVGVWIAAVTEVDEVPPAFLGVIYASLTGLGIAAGVALRRSARNDRGDGR